MKLSHASIETTSWWIVKSYSPCNVLFPKLPARFSDCMNFSVMVNNVVLPVVGNQGQAYSLLVITRLEQCELLLTLDL